MTNSLTNMDAASASFVHLLPEWTLPADRNDLAHGTTIVAAVSAEGVVMAGDRRATMGSHIVLRDIEKVYPVDRYTVMGVAGTAGIASEFQRLFSTELEHYEKIEHHPLSLSGKSRRLAGMIRGHLGLAKTGLVVLPVLAGWDQAGETGRIFTFDIAGGCYEEREWCALGSGSSGARGSLKKLYRPEANTRETVIMLIQALIDAADDDSATAGLDLNRQIFPSVLSVGVHGVQIWTVEDLAEIISEVLSSRQIRPDGPGAPIL